MLGIMMTPPTDLAAKPVFGVRSINTAMPVRHRTGAICDPNGFKPNNPLIISAKYRRNPLRDTPAPRASN
jgi:hypothetical protein